MSKMWMVRADGGRLYRDFRDKGIAGIGWTQLAHHAKPGMTKKELADLHLSIAPETKEKMAASVASQVWRFMNEIKVDDVVVTYSPASRTYLIGKVTGACESRVDLVDAGMPLARTVVWQDRKINRDDLTDTAKASLGSMLAVFVVPTLAAHELLGTTADQPVQDVSEGTEEPVEVDPSPEMEWTLEALQQLEWKRFEMLCVWYYEAKGFTVETVPQGADGGADATLYMKGKADPIALVQCRAWSAPVKVTPVRALGGVMHAKKVERGIFWSRTGFVGKPVKDYAEEAGIQLLDGAGIVERIRALDAEKRDELLTRAFEGDYQTPTCAACGIKMVVRQGDGGSFWGCYNYPKGCRVKIPRAA
ncbi:restriction endonuclease [Ralstonia mannitolilytica]|uniref:restriction endonuclease n=1 Tax=Ralstonia mannitolilytica TaxID=105219 RepID=UPI002155E79C|nr:restriction endonuclease [Ralstonia mannitolilytica]